MTAPVCTRLRVLGLYTARSAESALHFLRERLLKEFPFPIQRVQTDRGSEFVALDFQDALREVRIKFRPNRPRAPHLNGKVERSQRTDRMEFWATVEHRWAGPGALQEQLLRCQRFYNEDRIHAALGSKTPRARLEELQSTIPSSEVVQSAYASKDEQYVTNRILMAAYLKVATGEKTSRRSPHTMSEGEALSTC